MNVCEVCSKDSGKGKTCSSTCRSKLNRATLDATVPDATLATVPDATVVCTFKDACGNEHQIDFESRRKDYDLLESWADGTGYQYGIGQLARQYRYKLVDDPMPHSTLKQRTEQAVSVYLGLTG